MDIKDLFKIIWIKVLNFLKKDLLPIVVKSAIEVLMNEYGNQVLPSDYENNKKRLIIKAKLNLSRKGLPYNFAEREIDKAFNKALFVMNEARKKGENPVKYYEKKERIC